MTLVMDIERYGAKGATLSYIKEQLPDCPIPPFVKVGINDEWKEHKTEINSLGECMVRSSSPVEDGKTVSFAGLFDTCTYYGEDSVTHVKESATNEDALLYAKIHNVPTPLQMGLLFQKKSPSRWNYGILRHPHQNNILFVMGRSLDSYDCFSRDYIYNETDRSFREIDKMFIFTSLESYVEPPNDVGKAIEWYKKIEELSELNNGYSYHMEFGTEPFAIYQFRPFRKKEIANWRVEDLKSKRNETNYELCFGITPPEGVELNLVKARTLSRMFGSFLPENWRELKDEELEELVVKEWGLSKKERIFAKEFVRLESSQREYNWDKAFDFALTKLNSRNKKEKTCLLQREMHFYRGKDIDLIFPNATAYIAHMGYEFLSHNWFRAMQTYQYVLIGTELWTDAGHKVRVYSDGIQGRVIR